MIVRVDLSGTEEELGAVAAHVIPALVRHQVTAVAVLAFEDTEGESIPALGTMMMACTGVGITVETVAVARDGMAYTPGHPFADSAHPAPVGVLPLRAARLDQGGALRQPSATHTGRAEPRSCGSRDEVTPA